MWIQTPGVINWQCVHSMSGVRRCIYPLASLSHSVMLSGSCSLSVRYTVMFAKWLWINLLGKKKKSRKMKIVNAKCLFPFELLLRLISALLKMYSLVIPSHVLLYSPLSPSAAHSFPSMLSLPLCVSWLYFIGVGCVSLSLSLFVQRVSSFILCLGPSFAFL